MITKYLTSPYHEIVNIFNIPPDVKADPCPTQSKAKEITFFLSSANPTEGNPSLEKTMFLGIFKGFERENRKASSGHETENRPSFLSYFLQHPQL